MDFVTSMMMDTAAVPVVVSVVLVLMSRLVPRVADLGAVIAVSGAFFCGWASQQWTTLSPVRYLDWLPYAALGLAVCAVLSCRKVGKRYSWPALLLGCVLAAVLLVPDFPKLQPTRPVAVAMVSMVSVAVGMALSAFEVRLPARALTATLMVTGTAASLVLAQSFGLKFAQIAGMLTASLAGPFVFPPKDQKATSGVAFVFVALISNLMFMGYASSSSAVPVYSFLLIPFTALPLLLLAGRPETRSRKRIIAAVFGVAVLVGVAVVPALLAHPPWQEDY